MGGYECKCNSGFYGNGYTCVAEATGETTEYSSEPPPNQCQNGYYYDDVNKQCIDIDECVQYANICDENADCINRLGGYDCRCRSGFYRRGSKCYAQGAAQTTEEPSASSSDSTPSIPGLAPEHWLCDQCSEHADCNQGVCVCRNGWNGDGIECMYNCPDDSVWDIDRCVPISAGSEEEDSKIRKQKHYIQC